MKQILRQMKNASCSEEFISYVGYILHNKEIDSTCLIYISEHEIDITTEDGYNLNIKD